jgi:hypothetical protein
VQGVQADRSSGWRAWVSVTGGDDRLNVLDCQSYWSL